MNSNTFNRFMSNAVNVANLSDMQPNSDIRFPEYTPLGMAYVPFQQWETPYDVNKAFNIGTIFPSLDYPWKGGA